MDAVTMIAQKRGPTLAQKLGDVAHVSLLLRKAIQASGCGGDRIGEWLLKCAVLRGASHYAREFAEDLPADSPDLSDEELGVALCLGQHPYDSVLIRAAAQLLSSREVNAMRLARLAVMERTEPALLHIADAAARFAPEAPPWVYFAGTCAGNPHRRRRAAALVAFREPDGSNSLRRRTGYQVAFPARP